MMQPLEERPSEEPIESNLGLAFDIPAAPSMADIELMSDTAAMETAARETAARETAARETAERERVARETAARETAEKNSKCLVGELN